MNPPAPKGKSVMEERAYDENDCTEQDERGNTYWGIEEDIRDRLRSRLMRAVLTFTI